MSPLCPSLSVPPVKSCLHVFLVTLILSYFSVCVALTFSPLTLRLSHSLAVPCSLALSLLLFPEFCVLSLVSVSFCHVFSLLLCFLSGNRLCNRTTTCFPSSLFTLTFTRLLLQRHSAICSSAAASHSHQQHPQTAGRTPILSWQGVIADAAQVRPTHLEQHRRPCPATVSFNLSISICQLASQFCYVL